MQLYDIVKYGTKYCYSFNITTDEGLYCCKFGGTKQ